MRAFRIAYDGRPFHGFQRQPDVPTVEDALLTALRALDVCEDVPANYAAAGRTDAGVSAVAQTVAFDCPEWCVPSALNSELPATIRAWASTPVPPDFHATHDANRREYVYHLFARTASDDLARDAARRLSGGHDFHNLTTDERGTRRDISIELRRDGAYLVLRVSAGGFPRQLVRRVASLIGSVASGDAPLETVDRVLSEEPVDGPAGVPPAPAYPLVLAEVEYDVAFEVDDDAATAARDRFSDRRIEHATRSRVADSILDGLPGDAAESGDRV